MVPGNADKSVLMQALRHDELQMPPERKLPAEVIEQFARWIELGAADPRDEPSAAAPTAASKDHRLDRGATLLGLPAPGRRRTAVVQQPQWPRRRHDYFVLARMEQAGLNPSPPASPRRLATPHQLGPDRVCPRPIADGESAARRPASGPRHQIIDQLMASPQFGERWARVWLDLARYAEDQAHIVGDDKSLFFPTRIATAIGSSRRSIEACPTTNSSDCSWPPTCVRRRTNSSPPSASWAWVPSTTIAAAWKSRRRNGKTASTRSAARFWA